MGMLAWLSVCSEVQIVCILRVRTGPAQRRHTVVTGRPIVRLTDRGRRTHRRVYTDGGRTARRSMITRRADCCCCCCCKSVDTNSHEMGPARPARPGTVHCATIIARLRQVAIAAATWTRTTPTPLYTTFA